MRLVSQLESSLCTIVQYCSTDGTFTCLRFYKGTAGTSGTLKEIEKDRNYGDYCYQRDILLSPVRFDIYCSLDDESWSFL